MIDVRVNGNTIVLIFDGSWLAWLVSPIALSPRVARQLARRLHQAVDEVESIPARDEVSG